MRLDLYTSQYSIHYSNTSLRVTLVIVICLFFRFLSLQCLGIQMLEELHHPQHSNASPPRAIDHNNVPDNQDNIRVFMTNRTIVIVWDNKLWRNRRGGGECPQRLLSGNFLLTYREKRGKEKMENGADKKEIEKGKVESENWRKKSYKMWEDFVGGCGGVCVFVFVFVFLFVCLFLCLFVCLFVCLFFAFSLFKTTGICFGSTKMGIFYRQKAFHDRKKSEKMTLAPLKNILLRPWQQGTCWLRFTRKNKFSWDFKVACILFPCLFSCTFLLDGSQ